MSATQVILLERVEKLGNLGEIVSVKPGYARNFLIPQKKALRASKDNIAYFEAQKKSIEAANEKARTDAEKSLKSFDNVNVVILRQSSEAGQLFGSVTARDIAEAVTATTGISVAKAQITLNQNYKYLGLFTVPVALHPEVIAEVTINIARNEEEAAIQQETGRAITEEAPVVEEEAPAAEALIDEEALSDVLEDDALEAEKARAEEEAAAQAEADAKAAEKAAVKAEKAAAKAAEEEAAAAEAESESESGSEDASGDSEEETSEDA